MSHAAQGASKAPLFVILTGASADPERFAACQDLAKQHWPEAAVYMPNYLSRFHGLRGIGRWLDRWVDRTLPEADAVVALAYVLGGAVLPYAPALQARVRKIVLLRSRYQEAIPRALRAWFGAMGSALLFGKSVADLGRGRFWPAGFQLPYPELTLVETEPSRLAVRLRVSPLSDEELQITSYRELAIDHDVAYHSPALMKIATDWLKNHHS
jgi:hypothetical protein